MVDQALRDPISVSMLKTDGERLMSTFHMKPGPNMGNLLNALLEEVLDDPLKNTQKYLDTRTEELLLLDSKELEKLGEAGKKKREEAEEAEIQKIERSHKVG